MAGETGSGQEDMRMTMTQAFLQMTASEYAAGGTPEYRAAVKAEQARVDAKIFAAAARLDGSNSADWAMSAPDDDGVVTPIRASR